MIKIITTIFSFLIVYLIYGLYNTDSVYTNEASTDDPFPILKGKLVFHTYTDYGSADGQLSIYDFELDTLMKVSKSWDIVHTINGHFSPDGSDLVFMAFPKGQTGYYDWNVYKWQVGSAENPINLTPNSNVPNEDPKYFPDGNKVVIKQNGDIKIIFLSTKNITSVTDDGFTIEESMPYPTTDGQNIIYAKNGYIYMIDTNGTNDHAITSENDVESYYPIIRDSESFLYPRNASNVNKHDNVYIGYINSTETYPAPFNKINDDDSDPFPVKNTNYVFFSSIRDRGKGSWDIYLGDIVTGQVWSLNQFGINTQKSELGSAYFIEDYTQVNVKNKLIVSDYELNQNYPNPFNPNTKISFTIPNISNVRITIFNLLGEEVAELVNQEFSRGNHTIVFNAAGQGAGIYYCKIQAGSFIDVIKMILLK